METDQMADLMCDQVVEYALLSASEVDLVVAARIAGLQNGARSVC
jgi:hypothetical protein